MAQIASKTLLFLQKFGQTRFKAEATVLTSLVVTLRYGVSSSTDSNLLTKSGACVTIFEARYGVGRWNSTKVARDSNILIFDFGMQYIGIPMTYDFQGHCMGGVRGGVG